MPKSWVNTAEFTGWIILIINWKKRKLKTSRHKEVELLWSYYA